MNTLAIVEKLKALASNDQKRSQSARFREVFQHVENTLAAGVSRSDVLDELRKNGINYTLKGLDSALRRNRTKAKKTGKSNQPTPQQQHTKPAEQPQQQEQSDEPKSTAETSHNPTAIDAIISSKPDLAALAKLSKNHKK